MESWPTLAWVLLLSLIADCLRAVQPRDFTVKDIIYLHPSSKIPFTCFKQDVTVPSLQQRKNPEFRQQQKHWVVSAKKIVAFSKVSLCTKESSY